MSTTTTPSRSQAVDSAIKKNRGADAKLENRLNIKDLEALQEAFSLEGDGYNNKLSLTREQFIEALSLILNKGSREEYAELFDKIDVAREGTVDWDKLASHMLLEFYEKDDRVKSTQLPQWKDLKYMPGPHKDAIQRITLLRNSMRYLAVSREGNVSLWGQDLKIQRHVKTGTDACRQRDLWVTDFAPLQNINKLAISFTSKEIAFYDMSSKLDFNCQYKLQGLQYTPLCLDYWSNPDNVNEAVLAWGDVGGSVNAIFFSSANIALFERPPAPAQEKQDIVENMGFQSEATLNVRLSDIVKGKFKYAKFLKHQGHTEWVRQVRYISNLECFISCSTTWNNSMIIGWMEKHGHMGTPTVSIKQTKESRRIVKTAIFQVHQGINAFDYHEGLNLIATAGANHHVCLWNPYVVSKPNGLLRGHMAAVVQVQFNRPRGQLISFSKDKVLRIWDVQLQVCVQRLAGMFPKGPEVMSVLFLHEERNRLFITFNYNLTMLEMKAEVRDKIMSHEKPVVAALYNSAYNQVVSACHGGNVICWMIDTGQKVKTIAETHGQSEITALAQDHSETRLFTGSTDGTVKIWDFNGHCYHTLICAEGDPADIGQIVILKRSIVVVGYARHLTVFRTNTFKDYHVHPSEWKGGQEHQDDVLAASFLPSHTLATGSYDGEIVIWNINSEVASRRMNQRSRGKSKRPLPMKDVLRASHVAANKKKFQQHMSARKNKRFQHLNAYLDADKASTLPPMKLRDPGKSKLGKIPNDAERKGSLPKDDRTRSPTRGKVSKPSSRSDETDAEEPVDPLAELSEFKYAISKLIFLDARKSVITGKAGANLMSCGGNGIVRMWNSNSCELIAEFTAHEHAGSIIMNTDHENEYLVTGDVDGQLKVWKINDYCLTECDELLTTPPFLNVQWTAHSDMINSIEFTIRNERNLIITASSDCSVGLWDVNGNKIGIFGQESHWKIEPFPISMSPEEVEDMKATELSLEIDQIEEQEAIPDITREKEAKLTKEIDWQPSTKATDEPDSYRINTWKETYLGKDYQELRVKKRQRKQPTTIPDLPYLFSDKTGRPPFGPFYSLDITAFDKVEELEQPDFMDNPDKYFAEKQDLPPAARGKLPLLAETLKAAFDERSLFPRYISEYDQHVKRYNQYILGQNKVLKIQTNNSSTPQPTGSPTRRKPQTKLKPINRQSKDLASIDSSSDSKY